jgi:RHS repeat-associated protein
MNRLVSANGATYSSNQNGSLVALNSPNGNSSFTWDDRDNLLTITGSLGNHVYEYDGLENRRRRDSTRYILDLVHNENVLMETNLAGVPTSIYIYGLGLECRIDPVTNAIYYYHFDFNGNTIAISDSSQQIVQEYTYNAFGRIKTANGNYAQAPGNPFTYVGKYGVIDEGNGLYFMRARYYDSNTGRFLSEDPKWDENLFPYANNNPVVYIDPNGESATSDAWNRGWQDAIERLNKSLSDPLTYETAFGGAMLMANGGKVGSISKQFTRSSPQFGQAMHKLYKTGQANRLTTFKEFTGIKGIRPDFVDFSTKTISELKPYNPRGIMQGDKQLNKYKSIFEKHYGGTWNTVLDTY